MKILIYSADSEPFSVCLQPWKRGGDPGVQLHQGGRRALAPDQGDQARQDCLPHGENEIIRILPEFFNTITKHTPQQRITWETPQY